MIRNRMIMVLIPILLLNLILVGCVQPLLDNVMKSIVSSPSATFNEIAVYANDQVNPDLIKSSIEAVKLAEKENNQYVSKTNTPLSIYLLDEETFDKEFEGYEYSKGLYYSTNQQIFIRVEEDINDLFYFQSTEAFIQNTVAHEYTHYRLSEEMEKDDLEEDSIPIWFNEGYCEFVANRVSKKSSPMYEEFSEEIFKSYDILVSNEEWQANSGDYIQALATVKELMVIGKNETIQTILEGLKQGEKWDSILSTFFKIDISSDEFALLIKMRMKDFYTEGILF